MPLALQGSSNAWQKYLDVILNYPIIPTQNVCPTKCLNCIFNFYFYCQFCFGTVCTDDITACVTVTGLRPVPQIETVSERVCVFTLLLFTHLQCQARVLCDFITYWCLILECFWTVWWSLVCNWSFFIFYNIGFTQWFSLMLPWCVCNCCFFLNAIVWY